MGGKKSSGDLIFYTNLPHDNSSLGLIHRLGTSCAKVRNRIGQVWEERLRRRQKLNARRGLRAHGHRPFENIQVRYVGVIYGTGRFYLFRGFFLEVWSKEVGGRKEGCHKSLRGVPITIRSVSFYITSKTPLLYKYSLLPLRFYKTRKSMSVEKNCGR